MPDYSFNTIYDNSIRPSEYSNITVCTEYLNPGTVSQYERPTVVFGYIYPLATTSGRRSAPEPASQFRVGATKRIPNRAKAISPRNTGRVDMDKGHIIALELGGPDVAHNICPQWSQFQRNGEWREMEVEAHSIAEQQEDQDNLVMMTVQLIYGGAFSHTRGLCPARFQVDLTLNDTGSLLKRYVIDNTHSSVDDEMFYRVADPLDAYSEPSCSMGAPPSELPPLRASFGLPGAQPALTQQMGAENWMTYATRHADDSDDKDYSDDEMGGV